jgi:hypothetical protein
VQAGVISRDLYLYGRLAISWNRPGLEEILATSGNFVLNPNEIVWGAEVPGYRLFPAGIFPKGKYCGDLQEHIAGDIYDQVNAACEEVE